LIRHVTAAGVGAASISLVVVVGRVAHGLVVVRSSEVTTTATTLLVITTGRTVSSVV